MSTSELVQKYGRPRPRTDTVVNIQYMLEIAFTHAVGAFAAAGVGDNEPVPPEATDALLELARWIAHLGAIPHEPGPIESVYGVPLAAVPSGDRGVAWYAGRSPTYRLWLVTHVRMTPDAPVTSSWPDDLPIRDNSGFPFHTGRLTGFKLRAALAPLVAWLAEELQVIIAEGEGNLWTWSDADEEHHPAWHPQRFIDAVRVMLRQIRESSSVGGAAVSETELAR